MARRRLMDTTKNDKSNIRELSEMNYSTEQKELILTALEGAKAKGLTVVCGSTNSGMTTTFCR